MRSSTSALVSTKYKVVPASELSSKHKRNEEELVAVFKNYDPEIDFENPSNMYIEMDLTSIMSGQTTPFRACCTSAKVVHMKRTDHAIVCSRYQALNADGVRHRRMHEDYDDPDSDSNSSNESDVDSSDAWSPSQEDHQWSDDETNPTDTRFDEKPCYWTALMTQTETTLQLTFKIPGGDLWTNQEKPTIKPRKSKTGMPLQVRLPIKSNITSVPLHFYFFCPKLFPERLLLLGIGLNIPIIGELTDRPNVLKHQHLCKDYRAIVYMNRHTGCSYNTILEITLEIAMPALLKTILRYGIALGDLRPSLMSS